MDRTMKDTKNKTAQEEVVATAVPVKPRNDFVLCSKCGTALKTGSGSSAYICPVCGTVFRLRMGTKIVQNMPVKEKQIHFTLTENAAKLIMKNEAKAQRKACKMSPRRLKKQQKQLQRALETLLAQNLSLKDYKENEVFVIDLGETGTLNITKSKTANPEQE